MVNKYKFNMYTQLILIIMGTLRSDLFAHINQSSLETRITEYQKIVFCAQTVEKRFKSNKISINK